MYNGEEDFIDVFKNEKDILRDIYEFYVAPDPTVVPSGRKPKIKGFIKKAQDVYAFDNLSYHKALHDLKQVSSNVGVKLNLLLNTNSIQIPINQLLSYLEELVSDGVIDAVTVGDEFFLKVLEIKKRFPYLKIHNSVYLKIDSFEKLLEYREKYGLDVYLIPPERNKNLSWIQYVKDNIDIPLKLMVNEGCLPYCPYRDVHLFLTSRYSLSDAINDLMESRASNQNKLPCRELYNNNKELIYNSNWVPPEEISRYEGLVDLIKIVGRSFSSIKIMNIVKSYQQKQFKGDLRDFVENFKHVKFPLYYPYEEIPNNNILF